MSRRSFVPAAAQSNAEWCHAFCLTHGIVGSFDAGHWSSPVRTPPYYPDSVTLLPGTTSEQALAGIVRGDGCSVKDSFACLDLRSAGFEPLFRAEWLLRQPAGGRVAHPPGWSVVTTEAGLREWERAWGPAPDGSGFFQPSLLLDETIAVLGCFDGDRVVGGAIANRSSAVIGLSNVFHVDGDLEAAWSAVAAVAGALWDDLPIVSYDSRGSRDAAHGAAFESIGELVVWVDQSNAKSGGSTTTTAAAQRAKTGR